MSNVRKFGVAEYHVMVSRLAKPGEDILETMDEDKWSMLNESIRRVIEQGEILDQVKKATIYNKEIPGLREKLGFYLPPIVPRDISGSQMHALHMAIGIAGEAAELLQNVFHSVVLGDVDDGNVDDVNKNRREELGDLEFYMEGFRQFLFTTRESIISQNIDKLAMRYAGMQYSDQAAQNRADKDE